MNAELEHLAADIEKLSGAGAEPIDPAFIMSQASANVIAMLVFGERLAAHEDFRRVNYCIHHCIASMELHPLARLLDKCAISFAALSYVLCAHFQTLTKHSALILLETPARLAFHLPFDPLKLRRMRDARRHVMGYMRQQIQKHRDTFDPSAFISCNM